MTLRSVVVHGLLLLLAAVAVVTLAARGLTPVPDLVLVLVAAIGLRRGWRGGVVAGLAGGWILDLLPPGASVVGWSALVYAAAGAAAGWLHRPGPVPFALVALATGMAAVVVDASGVVVALLRQGTIDVATLVRHLLATMTVGLLLGPLVLRLDGLLHRGRR